MSASESADLYFTFESRLNSFKKPQPVSKRRASNANIKGLKSVKWPHKFLSTQDLARAGFFYFPTQESPDNVACFICHSSLDGWEENDDPLVEHLRHSPNCGWAINAMIERLDGNFSDENPYNLKILEARRATFANKWPHEDKKGWKCHVKQMTEAGWKYTPTPGSDDMVQCTYCALKLDKWGKNDIPSHKHHELSPDCPFFALGNGYKKSPVVKKFIPNQTRISRSSRISSQSDLTVDSFASCQEDLHSEDDGSSMAMPLNPNRKIDKEKKTAPVKTWNTRMKKNDSTDVKAQKKRKELVGNALELKRGNKRSSEYSLLMEEAESIFPLSKRRTTRNRGIIAGDNNVHSRSNLSSQFTAKSRSKKVTSHHKSSPSSLVPLPAAVPDDVDIDRELEADLDRPMSEDEALEIPQFKNNLKFKHSMLSTEPPIIDNNAIDEELKLMEMEEKRSSNSRASDLSATAKNNTAPLILSTVVTHQLDDENAAFKSTTDNRSCVSVKNTSPQAAPKKKVRSHTRQPTRQLPPRKTRGSTLSSKNYDLPTNGNEATEETAIDIGNDTDITTVLNSKFLLEKSNQVERSSQNMCDIAQNSTGVSPDDMGRTSARSTRKVENMPEIVNFANEKLHSPNNPVSEEGTHKRLPGQSIQANTKRLSQNEVASMDSLPQQISETKSSINHLDATESTQLGNSGLQAILVSDKTTPSPKSPTISVIAHTPIKEAVSSRSSPFSDVENQPPSPKVSSLTKKLETTPLMQRSTHRGDDELSSKHNCISGLKSTQPWIAVDAEVVCWKSPSNHTEGSNSNSPRSLEKLLDGVYKEDLTNFEKKMTLEEWIHYNAQLAEEKLKNECERMVGNFEREGTRAIRALEGVECVE